MIELLYTFLDYVLQGSFLSGVIKMAVFLLTALIVMNTASTIIHIIVYNLRKRK